MILRRRNLPLLLAATILATAVPVPAGMLSKVPDVVFEVSADGAALQAEGYRKRVRVRKIGEAGDVGALLTFYEATKETPVIVRFQGAADDAVFGRIRDDAIRYGVRSITREEQGTTTLATTETLETAAPPAGVPEPEPSGPAEGVTPASPADAPDRGRSLWEGFEAARPEIYRQIDVYAENPSQTMICCRSGKEILLYSENEDRVRVLDDARALAPKVNRITYETDEKGAGAFVLWANAERKHRIPADR